RCTTWVAIGAARNPRLRQTWASTRGDKCALVPTAPEIFPTEAGSAARSRALADGGRFASSFQALVSPPKFVVHQRQLETEGGWLGVDAVTPADGRSEFVLLGPSGDDGTGWRYDGQSE